MPRRPSFFRLTLFVVLIAALGLAGCSSGNASSANSVGEVSTVTITDTVETSGSLTADKLATLKWSTGGIVDKVNIQVGDKVNINEILAGLRSDSVSSTIATAQSDLATAQRDLQDLLDSATALAQAQLNVITARKAVEVAQNNLDALAYPRASDALIKNTQARIWDAEKTLTLATVRYKEVRNHPDGDPQKTAAQLAMTNAQLSYNNLVATYNWYTGKPTAADIEETKAKLDVARAALDDARRNRDNVKAGADPLKLSSAQSKVNAAQATVNQMYIIAPFAAEVISIQAGTGNSVNAGDSAAELVDRNTLKVDTLVDDSSISSVSVGDPAAITMDSLPGVTLTGKVSRINRIGTNVNGLVKYTVVVSIDPTSEAVLFGSTVNVAITTGEPHKMLAVPVGAIFSDTRGEYVLVVGADGNSQRVNVVSGDLVESLVTITTTASLKEGDKVEIGTGSTSSGSSNNSGNNQGGAGGGGGIIVPGAGGPPGG